MAKLYYKYGSMGSSKTANALMTKFNYEEKGKRVLLLKPSIDNRDGEDIIKSRIGLEAKAECIDKDCNIKKYIIQKHRNKETKEFDSYLKENMNNLGDNASFHWILGTNNEMVKAIKDSNDYSEFQNYIINKYADDFLNNEK